MLTPVVVLFLNHSMIIDDGELRRYSSVWKRIEIFNTLKKVEDNKEIVALCYYLNITQLQALYLVKEALDNKVDLRFFYK